MRLGILQDKIMEKTTEQIVAERITSEIMLENAQNLISKLDNQVSLLKIQNESLTQKTQRLLREFEELEEAITREEIPDAETTQYGHRLLVDRVDFDRVRLHYAKAVAYLKVKLERAQK
jgi:hypothetical protein